MKITQDTYRHHISQQFNAELGGLRNHLLVMGGLVEQQVQNALQALVEGDSALAEQVRLGDKEVDRLELAIDEESTNVIARWQPAASDLRLVMSVVKMVADLERIGDEAKKIAKMALRQIEEGRAPHGYVEVRQIGTHVTEMVREALNAFARFDPEAALAIMKEDDAVDAEYKSATRALATFMMEDPRNISQCLSVMWVLRALERIGDHACNLAEQVIFMVAGKDVRHTPLDEAARIVER